MPATRDVVPTAFYESIPQFFPDRVRIEQPHYVKSSENGEATVDRWDVVYDNVPASIMPVIRLGEEWKNWRLEFTLEQVTHRTHLQGYYPNIKASHRMVDIDTGIVHNISAAHQSSHHRLTRVMSRVVEPEAIEGI